MRTSDAGAILNGTPLTPEAIESIVNPQRLPPYPGLFVTVRGTVRVDKEAPIRMKVPAADLAKCPVRAADFDAIYRASKLEKGFGLQDALVFSVEYMGYVPEQHEAKAVTIDQCAFVPRTVSMTFGQRLDVTNLDRVTHAPSFAESPLPILNLATPKAPPVKVFTTRPGVFWLIDAIGPAWLKSRVFVLPQSVHTVSADRGAYELRVPTGKQKIVFRHPAFEAEIVREIEAKDGVPVDLDVDFQFVIPDAGATK